MKTIEIKKQITLGKETLKDELEIIVNQIQEEVLHGLFHGYGTSVKVENVKEDKYNFTMTLTVSECKTNDFERNFIYLNNMLSILGYNSKLVKRV